MTNLRRVSGARHRLLASVVVSLAALLVSAPVSALSGDPYYGVHTGNRGVHSLVDTRTDNNGVTCIYGSNHLLRKMKIRTAVVYAYDRTAGTDTEWVGQRYVIEYQDVAAAGSGYVDWANYAVGPWQKVRATDRKPATWSTVTFVFGAGVTDHTSYRVSAVMGWFYPSKSHVDGKALDVYHYYRNQSPSIGNYTTEGDCSKDDL